VNPRRAARQHARETQRQRDIRRNRVRLLMGLGAVIGAIAVIAFVLVKATQAAPGKTVPLQGTQHINKGDTHPAYNSTPPTSGPHWNVADGGPENWGGPVNWGIYDVQIPDEAQIHNLEHGGIMIQYSCSDCPELVAQLRSFYERYWPQHRLPMFPNSSKLVVAPYYGLPSRITLTAWGRIETMDSYDEERITRFVDAYRDKGAPEAGSTP
jgi:hypothetical protein